MILSILKYWSLPGIILGLMLMWIEQDTYLRPRFIDLIWSLIVFTVAGWIMAPWGLMIIIVGAIRNKR